MEIAKKIIIRPTRGFRNLNLKELWQYRELLYFLTWGHLKVRYKQTTIGILWAVLQPLATMAVFTIFLGRLIRIPSQGIPYPIFTYIALLPWQFFSHAVLNSSQSFVNQRNLVQKVYFPRIFLPVSEILAALVDFIIAFSILIVMMFFYRIVPTLKILTLPFFVFLSLLTALGVSLWLSALNVKYRDVVYTLPFLTQLWFFLTPIVYPATLITTHFWKIIYNFNPMVAVVEGFRWALLGESGLLNPLMWLSVGASLCFFMGGLIYFCRIEKEFADLV